MIHREFRGGGPLAEFVPGFEVFMAERGYATATIRNHVVVVGRVSRALAAKRTGLDAVDATVLERRLTPKCRRARDGVSSQPFVLYLQSVAVFGPIVAASSSIDVLLDDYRRYLVVERSLMPATLAGDYMPTAALFLSECCGDDPARVAELTTPDIAGFLAGLAQRRSPRSVNNVVVGLRSLLRWLFLRGLIDAPLAQATPWTARGVTSSLPRGLPSGHAALMLASCDRASLVGARDFALLTVLIRLGLRVGEVTVFELGDIDWRNAEISVRSKGGWRDPLPLPSDVGEALVAYLQRRGPEPRWRQVFLRVTSPPGPITMTNLRAVVRRACERAGIPDTGTHRLRHGVATAMLAAGAPLHEIGQVLRHRDVETTAIYAKVDYATLATVARPWPGTTR
jgi:site-specific recombinase XerD